MKLDKPWLHILVLREVELRPLGLQTRTHKCTVWIGPASLALLCSCQPSQWARSQWVPPTISFCLLACRGPLPSSLSLPGETVTSTMSSCQQTQPEEGAQCAVWTLTVFHPQWLFLWLSDRTGGFSFSLVYVQRIGVQSPFWTNHNTSSYLLTHDRIFLYLLMTKRWAFEILVLVCFIYVLTNHGISTKNNNINMADCFKTHPVFWTSSAFISRPRKKMSPLICVIVFATFLSPRL